MTAGGAACRQLRPLPRIDEAHLPSSQTNDAKHEQDREPLDPLVCAFCPSAIAASLRVPAGRRSQTHRSYPASSSPVVASSPSRPESPSSPPRACASPPRGWTTTPGWRSRCCQLGPASRRVDSLVIDRVGANVHVELDRTRLFALARCKSASHPYGASVPATAHSHWR